MKSLFTLCFFCIISGFAVGQDQGIIKCNSHTSVTAWEQPGSIAVIRQLACGKTVIIVGLESGYAKVQINENLTAYVETQYLHFLQPQTDIDLKIAALEAQIKALREQSLQTSKQSPTLSGSKTTSSREPVRAEPTVQSLDTRPSKEAARSNRESTAVEDNHGSGDTSKRLSPIPRAIDNGAPRPVEQGTTASGKQVSLEASNSPSPPQVIGNTSSAPVASTMKPTPSIPLQVSDNAVSAKTGIGPVKSHEATTPSTKQQDGVAEALANSTKIVYIQGKVHWAAEHNGTSVMMSAEQGAKNLILSTIVVNSTSQPLSFVPERVEVKDLLTNKNLAYVSPDRLAADQRKAGSWRNVLEGVGAGMQAYGASAPRVSSSYSRGTVNVRDQYGNTALGSYSGTSTTLTTPSQAEVQGSANAIQNRVMRKRQLREEKNEMLAKTIESTALYANTIASGSRMSGKIYFSKAKVGSLRPISGQSVNGFALHVKLPFGNSLFDFTFPIAETPVATNK